LRRRRHGPNRLLGGGGRRVERLGGEVADDPIRPLPYVSQAAADQQGSGEQEDPRSAHGTRLVRSRRGSRSGCGASCKPRSLSVGRVVRLRFFPMRGGLTQGRTLRAFCGRLPRLATLRKAFFASRFSEASLTAPLPGTAHYPTATAVCRSLCSARVC